MLAGRTAPSAESSRWIRTFELSLKTSLLAASSYQLLGRVTFIVHANCDQCRGGSFAPQISRYFQSDETMDIDVRCDRQQSLFSGRRPVYPAASTTGTIVETVIFLLDLLTLRGRCIQGRVMGMPSQSFCRDVKTYCKNDDPPSEQRVSSEQQT